jgi:2,3-bisphosphoglycerate-independent phosphoglycerate mutase
MGNFVLMSQKALLMILDGWGIGRRDHTDAVFQAKTPFVDHLFAEAPHTTLKTYGENVGLPDGQMGNSEVGHLNIGAGRVVWQMLVRINKAFESGSIVDEPGFKDLLEKARHSNRKIHLMGLVSDGGVHSSIEHLEHLCRIFQKEGLEDSLFIHAFLDGRDTDPHSGLDFLKRTLTFPGNIASVIGRYYAMDRDKRWERVQRAHALMVNGMGIPSTDLTASVQAQYAEHITDEFMEPIIHVNPDGKPMALIAEGDIVLCFNFRTDRGREITTVLTQQSFPELKMDPLKLHYYTLTEYDKSFKNVSIIFGNDDLKMTLGEVMENHGLTQIRAAETEKYPHVTFFFSGGREDAFKGESRILIPSPKVATYDLQPEMSAPALTDAILTALDKNETDFYCINFANPDMVGHTGVFDAIVKACETVDGCAEKIANKALSLGIKVVIIADHGNADNAINPDGTPNTAHSLNPVPCFVLGEPHAQLHEGVLADVAPTILKLMQIHPPFEMTGNPLY